MARLYQDLSDDDLNAKITKLRDAIESVAVGGEVTDFRAEGRQMVITPVNTAEARTLLDALVLERCKRTGEPFGGCALRVDIR